MGSFIIIVFIGFGVFAIFAAISAHRKAKERIAALSAWARSRQLGFDEEKRRDFVDYYPELILMGRGIF